MSGKTTNNSNGFSKAEITQVLEQFVHKGKLRKGWNKKGKLVYQDTKVKPSRGIKWLT